MTARHVTVLALATQGALIAMAWVLSWFLDAPPTWGHPARDAAIGAAGALALAGVNYLLLVRAPSFWLVDGVRAVYHEMLLPLFGTLSRPGVIVIGVAAGVGEEWLFRGVVQPQVGLVMASLLFGAAHLGGVRMLAFGVWASCMGFALGGLALLSGGITAPMVAHGLYDVLALEYIRKSYKLQVTGSRFTVES